MTIRVRIVRGVEVVRLGAPGERSLLSVNGRAGMAEGEVIIRASESGDLVVEGADGEAVDAEGLGGAGAGAGVGVEVGGGVGGASVVVSPGAGLVEGADLTRMVGVLVDGRRVPGEVEVVRTGAGLDVIGVMRLGEYVPGVLEAELYAGWPMEAYRAQAIAARSYALHERGRARARGRAWDIDDSELHQVFAGTSAREEALRATRETAGLVLTYGGELLRAYYHSTSGGRPARAADLWPTGGEWSVHLAPPLNPEGASEDYSAASPTHRWSVRRGVAEVSARLAAYGRAQGASYGEARRIARVEARARNPAGRPTVFALTDADGREFEISAEHFRQAMNFPAPGLKALRRADRVLSHDVEVEISGDRVLIEGRGFGHGVGLCQYGAAAMAERGFDHRAILAQYYPGATVEVWSSGGEPGEGTLLLGAARGGE